MNYVLPHDLAGEQQRLALMSKLLDPFHRRLLEALGLQPGWKVLEVGCGNGSISEWMTKRVSPGGHVVASDIDLSYIGNLHDSDLEVRRIDILSDPIEQGAYDLVTARAMLHHLPAREKALERMIAAVKPGGVFLSIEPDMLPATAAEPESARSFWQGWLAWSSSMGIDYFVGRKMPALLAGLGQQDIASEGYTAFYCGRSPWAVYWSETLRELQPKLLGSGFVTDQLLSDFLKLYEDPSYWTSAITFVGASGRKRTS